MKTLKNKLGKIGAGLAILIGLAGCGEKSVESPEQSKPKTQEYFFTSIADFNRQKFPYFAGYPPVAGDFDNDGDLDILVLSRGIELIIENRIPRKENSEPEIKQSPEEY